MSDLPARSETADKSERVRAMLAHAWDEGYEHADNGRDEADNPYRTPASRVGDDTEEGP